MGRFSSVQYQKRRPSMTSPYSFEQPVSQFAPLLSPTHQSPPPAVDAQLEYAHLSGPTLDQISISPPTRPAPPASAQHVSQALQEQNIVPPENRTGLPDALKTGVECLSGFSLDDVRVHYNSSKPAEVEALAYAQGSEIYMGPGQEQYLAHEAWHVVQQKQGRVEPTLQMKGVAINDDVGLEREASVMGKRAVSGQSMGAMPSNNAHLTPESEPHHITQSFEPPMQLFYDPDELKRDGPNLGDALLYIQQKGQDILKNYQIIYQQNEWGNKSITGGLKRHGEIIRNIRAEPGLPGTINRQYEKDDILEIIQNLNILEQETQTWTIVNREPAFNQENAHDIKIGTEFTFSNRHLQTVRVGEGSEEKAEPFITRWTDYVRRRAPRPNVGPAAGAKSRYAQTFSYMIGDNNNTPWSWTLDVDEGCLETQTQPSTLPELTTDPIIKRIISEHIFAGAREVDLAPDPTASGGGGHISIDAETAFGKSAEAFLEFCSHLQKSYGGWQEYFQDEDRLNAPWLVEMESTKGKKPLERFNASITDFLTQVGEGNMDLGKAVQEIKKFNQTLINLEVEKMREDPRNRERVQNVAHNPDHYQAVNIEHMSEDAGRARLELRRIPAQENPAKLKNDINFIFELISRTRDVVAKRQQARMHR